MSLFSMSFTPLKAAGFLLGLGVVSVINSRGAVASGSAAAGALAPASASTSASFSPALSPNLDDGVAIHGYDPVSYFQARPLKGDKALSFSYGNAKYLFSSKQNLESFKAQPQKFEPQFGGWCAYAMATGDKVDVDPETFKILDGKTYLFYNGIFGNTLKKWNKDEASLLKKADEQWRKIDK